MISGEFIQDRWIVATIRAITDRKAINFSSWSDDWVIELRTNDQVHRVIGYKFDINNSVASTISQDKVATSMLLSSHNVPTVRHELVRTKVSQASKEAMSGWDAIVIKPLEGTSGHGVKLLANAEEAIDVIESSIIQAWAAAPFIDIEREVRIIMLDQTMLLAYEKQPVVIDGLKMFNLGLGATPVVINPDATMLQLAQLTQKALALRLAAIDIITATDGTISVLEVNDGIMMEHFARASQSNRRRTEKIYESIIDSLFYDHN